MEDLGTQEVDSLEGATDEGQPSQPEQGVESQASEGQGFDTIAAQSDYTRKTQELAEQRKEVEQLRSELQQTIQSLRSGGQQQGFGGQQYQQPYQQSNYGQYQQTQQLQNHEYNYLVDQFGEQGAQAVTQLLQKQTGDLQKQFYTQMFNSEYNREMERGQTKFGDDFKKHDYTDPQTGIKRNKVIDGMVKGLTLDQSWRAFNDFDMTKKEQEIRDKVYQEQQKKANATPATSTTQPKAKGTGHANSIEEAFEQAEAELGRHFS